MLYKHVCIKKYVYKLVQFYWWLNDFIKTVSNMTTYTCIFTWGAAGITGKLFSLKDLYISFVFNCLTPSVCTCDIIVPVCGRGDLHAKCTLFYDAVSQRSTNKTKRHKFFTNFHTYSSSKRGGANVPTAPSCALALKPQSQWGAHHFVHR